MLTAGLLRCLTGSLTRPAPSLLTSPSVRHINCNRAAIAKVRRTTYKRLYPTLLVNADGSTLTIRYHEPRKIIKLPLDLSTLSEEQRMVRLEKRKPKVKVVVDDDLDDVTFTPELYRELWSRQ